MASSHILIVEDEGIIARDIKNRLKGFGYAVCALVSSGEEAIKKVEEMHPDLVLMDNELSVFLFRAVRELLMNVVRHAQVHKAQVSLRRKDENLHITVEDRGVGFDPATLEVFSDRSSRFGLFSIRERLQYFRGEMTVISQPGQGTRVTLVVPLRAAKKSAGGT